MCYRWLEQTYPKFSGQLGAVVAQHFPRGFCPSWARAAWPRPRQCLLSLPHALRFLLATDPQALTLVLGVACRTISGYLIRKAGLTRATGDTGAVTFVQRFGSALNLERDIERSWLALDSEAGPMDDLLGHAITSRIAVGPRAGQKLFMLRMLLARQPEKDGVARTGGFTLHAGVCVAPGQHAKRERLRSTNRAVSDG